MRYALIYLSIFLSSFVSSAKVLARTATATGTSSTRIQVVYVIEKNTILTYNVQPQTLDATQVGSLTVNNTGVEYYGLVTAPNDHFVYLIADNADGTRHLSVYRTNTSGAPQAPATQGLNFNGFYGMQFDPHANFAYAVFEFPSGSYSTADSIRRYLVNQTTGAISSPVSEAKYLLANGAEGTEDCGVELMGFNSAATTLSGQVACSGHGSTSARYYQHTLNTQTGALGPDVQIYAWNNGTQGFESVQFVANHMFDFVVPNNDQADVDSVNVYPIVPNTKTPVLHCTGSMLEACGNATGVAHPSGQYVFMAISSDTTQIDKVDLNAHKIVDTGTIFRTVLRNSVRMGLCFYGIYNLTDGDYYIEIYGFNVTTSGVTPGGPIYVPCGLDPFFVAERY